MKERPILFSGEMVRAILDGRKTQTRRVINPQPQLYIDEIYPEQNIDFTGQTGRWWTSSKLHNGCDWAHKDIQCPYGHPGDRLWVREAFAHPCEWTYDIDCDLPLYRVCDIKTPLRDNVKWHPSIHMPRWASRINLEITDVCVERLQDISEEDARSEGINNPLGSLALNIFPSLWDSINLKRGYGWDSNPWVWVVEFKRLP